MVGRQLLMALIKREKHIRALYRTPEKRNRILTQIRKQFDDQQQIEKISWVRGDVTDIPRLEKVFEGVTEVYHCAGLISFDVRDRHKLRKVNIEGTANMVNLALKFGVKKFCFLSSVAALGSEPPGQLIHEKSPRDHVRPHSYYDISKYGAEMEVWRASQEGLPVVILNPAIIIGPGNPHSGSGQIFTRIAKGFPFRIPRQSGFVAVNDVVSAMLKLMDSTIQNDNFIVVSENLKMEELTDMVAQHLHRKPPFIKLKKWMVWLLWIGQSIGYIFGASKQITHESIKEIFTDATYDNTKLLEHLDFKYTPIETAVSQTAKDYLKKHHS